MAWTRADPNFPAMRTVSLATASWVVLALAACREAPPLPARPTTLATHPHAMDRLARLMREEFRVADPAPVEQRIRCENARVARALGADFRTRLLWLQDSLRREFSSEQFNQLGQQLAHSASASGYDPMCRSFDAEAEREAPLKNE
ncbi:MAG: hypothetical protein JWN79_638 [Gemmatimonadetes bacterium]|jgi:hypothetical protein|nr:hypothetical protein [Gemmatimonadota bacterium]